MATIARNSRQIPDLKTRLTVCLVFRESNQYHGRACDPAHAWAKLEGPQPSRRARLTDDGAGGYTISVHDGLWYELREPDPAFGDPPWGTGPEPAALAGVDCRRRVLATEGDRKGQRGIVTGPLRRMPEISSTRYLPVAWDDGTESAIWPEYLVTAPGDPACAAGTAEQPCHMRYDGTTWYAVDSEIAAHEHELPAWARETYEEDLGRLEEAGEARAAHAAESRPEIRLAGLAAEADARLPLPGLAAHGPAMDHRAGYAAPYGGELPADLAAEGAPVPTLGSIRAVLDAAGINPDALPPTAKAWLVVAIALQRGWVRGRQDALARQAPPRPGPVTSQAEAAARMRLWAAEGRVTHGFDGDPGEKLCRRCAGDASGIQHTMPAGIPLD